MPPLKRSLPESLMLRRRLQKSLLTLSERIGFVQSKLAFEPVLPSDQGTVLVFYDHSELYINYEQGKNDHRTAFYAKFQTLIDI